MIYTLLARMESLQMNVKLSLPSFYFKNYHSFVMFNSILFFIMSITFPDVDDWSLKGMRYFLEFPIMVTLIILGISNFFLYSKSFISKSYTSIQDNLSECLAVHSVYIIIILKCMFQLLCLMYNLNKQDNLNYPLGGQVGLMCIFYLFSNIVTIFFVYHAFKGTYTRYKTGSNNNHWIKEYLSATQLKKIKTILRNDEIVSVYFNGFHLDEADNIVIMRKKKLNLKAFREYMSVNKLKIDDLSDDELTVIEMLGI